MCRITFAVLNVMCYVEEFSLFNDVIFMTASLLETAKALIECTEDDAAAFVESCLHRRHDDPIDPEEMLGQICAARARGLG